MNIEIERKYVIEKPEVSKMRECAEYTVSEITQTYLASPDGITRRVRCREYAGRTVWFETSKIRVDRISSEEYERELTREEYEKLLAERDTSRRPIRKTRHTFNYKGQIFEIDVYPEWERSCIMETELKTRETVVDFPDFIRVIREVTGDRRYSNASMARSFPEEFI